MIIGIGFSTTNLPISVVIRSVLHADESHTFIYCDDGKVKTVFGAEFHGYEEITFERFASSNIIVKMLRPRWNLEPGITMARSWLGQGYDFGELVGNLWVRIGLWFKRRWKNPFNSTTRLECAEAVAMFLQRCEYPGASTLDPTTTTPQEIEELLKDEPILRI